MNIQLSNVHEAIDNVYKIFHASLLCLVALLSVTKVHWWKTTRLVHGPVKSGATISGKLPELHMIHIPHLRNVYMEKCTMAFIMMQINSRWYKVN